MHNVVIAIFNIIIVEYVIYGLVGSADLKINYDNDKKKYWYQFDELKMTDIKWEEQWDWEWWY
jgi:hypothetical protein